MKKLIIVLLASLCFEISCPAQAPDQLSAYTEYAKVHSQSAKDYILSLFDTHDMVIICERTHPELTQYDLFTDIISDKGFIENVGNIFVEIGVSKLNPQLNDFLHTRNLPADSITARIMRFQRNASMWPIWAPANYAIFYSRLYDLNKVLPPDKQVNVYPSDIPFSWTEAESSNIGDLKAMLAGRDSIIASQVIEGFNRICKSTERRKKALVILNYRHAFNREFEMPGGHTLRNTAYYLFKQYNGKAANVFLNTVNYGRNDSMYLVQGGKWDAAFKKLNKESAGFNFTGSPFGKDSLDIWSLKNAFTYADVFTGFIFYQPVEKHLLAEGLPGLTDSLFKPELLRRIHLISVAGEEFKAKMAGFEKVVNSNPPLLNIDEKKKYYQLENLLLQRSYWLNR